MGFWSRLITPAVTTLALATMQAQAADKLFVYVSPNSIGVNAFLQMGKTGIEAAGKKYGADVKTYESNTPAERLENVNAAVNDGADIVVVLGFEFNDIIKQVAPTAPDTQFLIVDQCFDDRPANVHCAVFREYEASYLMGVAAGMLTMTAPTAAALPSVAPGGTTSAVLGTVTVSDARGITGATWTATVRATAPVTGTGPAPQTIPLSRVSYWSGPATATTGTGTFTAGQPTAGTAVNLTVTRTAFTLSGGSLANSASWTPTVSVAVPAAAVGGSYRATITESVS